MNDIKYSLLFPKGYEGFKDLSEVAFHDLGMDMIVKELSSKDVDQRLFTRILSRMSDDPEVSKYRIEIFDDIYRHPELCAQMMEILDKISFLKEYGSFKREFDEKASMWDLMHRLDEIKDYIQCVEAIYECLQDETLTSLGLQGLRDHVSSIYEDSGFEAIKRDIASLDLDTSKMKSVTVGINLNDRFEAETIGLVSVNDTPFTKSNVLDNFFDFVGNKEKYKYHPFSMEKGNNLEQVGRFAMFANNPLLVGLSGVPSGDQTADIPFYMDRVLNHMLSNVVKRIRDVLNKYVTISITDMTDLIPEFSYYIHFAEYIKKLEAQGARFCKPKLATAEQDSFTMNAAGIYNIKLASFPSDEHSEIVKNDLIFDYDHKVYLLTGANRGGKTTITQAIGQLFVLAQGGIYIPGESFEFTPLDNICTHFPADEDKTMDLGRLGEECKRFKELYQDCTNHTLLLLNETFSTTSFEEGYFIAHDSVKAILQKGVPTIYNTHMHKLAFDVPSFNEEAQKSGIRDRVQSLVVQAENGTRSYKVAIGEPVGQSFARDIAEKYGVTFEALTRGDSPRQL